MSANLFSLVAYLDLFNYGNATAWSPLYTNGAGGFADPVTPDGTWTALVEPNPVYAWFMASLTPAENRKYKFYSFHELNSFCRKATYTHLVVSFAQNAVTVS